MISLRRAALFTSLDRYLTLVITFISVMVVSRLLTPRELGAFAIVWTVIMIAEGIRDFATSYIVQKTDLDDRDMRSLVTMMTIATIATMIVILLLSEAIAHVSNDPEIGPLLRLASLWLLAGPIERPLVAAMRRDLDFRSVAMVTVTTSYLAVGTNIALAASGWGAASSVWGMLAGGLTSVVMALALRPRLYVIRPTLHGWREVLGFAAFNNTASVLVQITEMVPAVMIARLAGIDAAGAYNRALTVASLPSKTLQSAVSPLILPAYARHARSGGDLGQSLLVTLELLSALLWPALFLVALLAHPIVAILLGPQWSHITSVVQILAIATLPSFVTSSVTALLVAAGAVRNAALALLMSMPIMIILILVGALHGLTAMALSLIVANAVQAIVSLWVVRTRLPIQFGEVARALARSVPAIIGACLATSVCAWLLADGLQLSPAQGIVAALCGIAGWLAGLASNTHRLFAELTGLWQWVREAMTGSIRSDPPLPPPSKLDLPR